MKAIGFDQHAVAERVSVAEFLETLRRDDRARKTASDEYVFARPRPGLKHKTSQTLDIDDPALVTSARILAVDARRLPVDRGAAVYRTDSEVGRERLLDLSSHRNLDNFNWVESRQADQPCSQEFVLEALIYEKIVSATEGKVAKPRTQGGEFIPERRQMR
jgi:hypothetical protein